MQKITDKQFILSVFIRTIFKIDFYRTKIERKFRENEQNSRENEVENFIENTSKFAKIFKFSRISLNENFDGNPIIYIVFSNTSFLNQKFMNAI